jgi:hypothetical protein
LTREYAIDPLEILFVREVVRTNVVALSSTMTLEEARARWSGTRRGRARLSGTRHGRAGGSGSIRSSMGIRSC